MFVFGLLFVKPFLEVVQCHAVLNPHIACTCAAQLCEVCTAAKCTPYVACQRTYVRSFAADDAYLGLFLLVIIP